MSTSHGQVLGRYRLLQLLGAGGMGRVHAAELHGPAGFRKQVAVKVLRSDLSMAHAEARAALAREARLGGLLDHPNIVETYELGEHEGQWFVAMAWVRGPSLARLLEVHGHLTPRAALDLGLQVCAALAHLHELEVPGRGRGLIHRDLKPSNVLVDRFGGVRVADLGIAALQQAVGTASDRWGTPTYMAPEQVRGDRLDGRADLFALGATLAEMATGEAPFAGADADAILDADAWVAARGVAAAVDRAVPGLGHVVADLLRVDPAHRISSAREVAARLRPLLDGSTGEVLTGLVEAAVAAPPAHPSAASTFAGSAASVRPGSTAAWAPSSNLVPAPGPFIGREEELVAVERALEQGRLVTLKGAGGAARPGSPPSWA